MILFVDPSDEIAIITVSGQSFLIVESERNPIRSILAIAASKELPSALSIAADIDSAISIL